MPFFGPYIQRFVEAAPGLVIPLWQALFFVLLISIAALYERYRIILILAYIFMVHWVFIENVDLLALNYIWVIAGFVFLVFGLVAMLVTLYNMLTRSGQ
ncbi:MAG: hypothetical protein K9N51_08650 [Candidatus Pacebacteria bacterium]|nr:hypothetical protein [Candidatus Paceibacterota bacterium]